MDQSKLAKGGIAPFKFAQLILCIRQVAAEDRQFDWYLQVHFLIRSLTPNLRFSCMPETPI